MFSNFLIFSNLNSRKLVTIKKFYPHFLFSFTFFAHFRQKCA